MFALVLAGERWVIQRMETANGGSLGCYGPLLYVFSVRWWQNVACEERKYKRCGLARDTLVRSSHGPSQRMVWS